MEIAALLAGNFIALLAVILVLWGISVRIRDVSFIDAFWAYGMVLLAWFSAWQVWRTEASLSTQGFIILLIVTVWGLRLGTHLLIRWRDHGEDARYKKIIAATMEKKGWSWAKVALLQVFLLQAPLLFLVCLPAQISLLAHTEGSFLTGIFAALGIALANIGIIFETVGDFQLDRFKKDPANKGQVMDKGLWRYTRHPNYFGDACTWWGIWLVALDAAWWIGAVSVIGPIFLTFTLTKWSGGPLLERGMKKTRPGYADYVARTSAFFPLPPKKR